MNRKFFFRTLLFVLLFILISAGFSYPYVRYTRSPLIYQYTVQQFEAQQEDISVIILGDSHPLKGFEAAQIDGAYNFATKGEGYILTYYKMKKYLDNGKFEPKLAILPLDLHTFSTYPSEQVIQKDPAFWRKFVNYYELGKINGHPINFMWEKFKANFAYLGGIEEVADVRWPEPPWETEVMEKGFMPTPGDFSLYTPARRIDQGEERAALHFTDSTYLSDDTLFYFYRLLDLLVANDVQIVFVWYPTVEEYYQGVNGYLPVEQHYATMQSLIADYPVLAYLDYHDALWEHPEYFADSDHLNPHGAEIFTEMIVEDLHNRGILPIDQD